MGWFFGLGGGGSDMSSEMEKLLQDAEKEIAVATKLKHLDNVETGLMKKRSGIASKLEVLFGHKLDLGKVLSELQLISAKINKIMLNKRKSALDLREKARMEARVAELERQEATIRKRLAAFEKQTIDENKLAHYLERIDLMLARITEEKTRLLSKAVGLTDEDEAAIDELVREMSK